MTLLDLAAEEAAHVELRGYCADAACDCPWPCPTSTLIAVVRKQHEALVLGTTFRTQAVLAEVAALVDLGEPT